MSVNQSKPVVLTEEECDRRETKRRANLWSAVWEASQNMSFDEIREFVERTLCEIQSDEP